MKLTIKEIGDITGGQAIGDPSALVNGSFYRLTVDR